MESLTQVPIFKVSMSAECKDLFAAIAKAQAVMKPAIKNKINPHFKNAYADLESVIEAIKPIFDQGISLTQLPTGTNSLLTIVGHSSGQYIMAEMSMTPTDNRPQSLGSLYSYMRRYSIGSVFSVASGDDDDGNTVSADPKPAAKKPTSNVKSMTQDTGYTDQEIMDMKLRLQKLGYHLESLRNEFGVWPPADKAGWAKAFELSKGTKK